MQTNKGQINNTLFLNGVRFILALWVALGHLYKYMGGAKFLEIPYVGTALLRNGPAVDGFMIITGFLMMYHYLLKEQKEDPSDFKTVRKFWFRRFLRIFPLYLVSILAAFFLYEYISDAVYFNYRYFTGEDGDFHTTFSPERKPGLTDLFLHLTLMHGLFKGFNFSLLGPAWSLSLEMQFYLLFPFLFRVFLKRKQVTVPALIVVGIVLAWLSQYFLGIWEQSGKFMSFGAPSLLSYKFHFFILGMLIACVYLKRISIVYIGVWLVVVLPFVKVNVMVVVLLLTGLFFADWLKQWLPDLLFRLVNGFKNILGNRFFSWGADISYALYLVHMMTMPLILKWTILYVPSGKFGHAWLGISLFILITFVLSHCLFLLVEKPFIALGKKIEKRPARVVETA